MAKLIIAEKPSVAKDIAKVIGGVKAVKEGNYTHYRCNNDYIVAYARGHLIRLADPQEYDEKYEKWNISDLPILPQNFKLLPIDNAKSWLTSLAKLIKSNEVTSLICATDAGREGELIFRYIYNYLGCKKPFERLWISSLTNESIKQGLSNLQPSTKYDSMYRAGITRAKMDWLVGMNLSRLYSCCYRTNYSVGRVQTATVNMIAERDNEIKNFVKKPFYKLLLENGAEWFDDETDFFAEKEIAERVRSLCENKTATVTSAETKRKTENRPLLHSLNTLQQEANDKLGFSVAKTLLIAQSLYEKKLLTYPRTDSNYITDDMKQTIAETVDKLTFYDSARVEHLIDIGLNLDSRVINNAKVSDHHALLPTMNIDKMSEAELTTDEESVLKLVINRMLLTLDRVYEYDETRYVFTVEGNTFKITADKTVSLGWKEFVEHAKDSDFSFRQGETFTANNLTMKPCETQPPKPFTESTLLKAMDNIDRRIVDKSKREFVKERGLGTPATRAGIIEKIIASKYIERDKKNLRSTEHGRQLISSVPEVVKSVEMTANMESRLADIEKGEADEKAVIGETINLINKVLAQEKDVQHEDRSGREREVIGKCPRCGGNVYEGKGNFYCEKFSTTKEDGCIFSVWKNDFFFTAKKKEVTKTLVKTLLDKGKVLVKGLYSEKKDSTYDAYILFKDRQDKEGKTKVGFDMEFAERKK